jgi:hypothetical protein
MAKSLPISPERQKLAEAIAARTEAADRLSRLKAAQETLLSDPAVQAVEDAAATLAEAEAAAVGKIISDATGETLAMRLSVVDARGALQAARDRYDAIRLARKQIDSEVRGLEERRRWGDHVADRARAVLVAELSSAPSVLALLEDLSKARAELLRLGQQVLWLSEQGVVSADIGNCVYRAPVDWPEAKAVALDGKWQLLFDALTVDAGASLG